MVRIFEVASSFMNSQLFLKRLKSKMGIIKQAIFPRKCNLEPFLGNLFELGVPLQRRLRQYTDALFSSYPAMLRSALTNLRASPPFSNLNGAVRHATKKAGGSSKNGRDSPGQHFGVKLGGGSRVRSGNIIVTQVR